MFWNFRAPIRDVSGCFFRVSEQVSNTIFSSLRHIYNKNIMAISNIKGSANYHINKNVNNYFLTF